MTNYKSNYTGAEIDGTVKKLIDIPQEPTEEHIGKVVGVVEGESEAKGANPKYGLVPMSGGSEDFVVTFSESTVDGDAACDKTLSEIAEAYSRGANIRAVYSYASYDDTIIYNLTTSFIMRENVCIYFQGVHLTADSNGAVQYKATCIIRSDNTVEIYRPLS